MTSHHLARSWSCSASQYDMIGTFECRYAAASPMKRAIRTSTLTRSPNIIRVRVIGSPLSGTGSWMACGGGGGGGRVMLIAALLSLVSSHVRSGRSGHSLALHLSAPGRSGHSLAALAHRTTFHEVAIWLMAFWLSLKQEEVHPIRRT